MKKKFFIFDLDGVIFDSKKNMELTWSKTSKKFNLNVSFNKYFEKIGLPFLKILESLNIKPEQKILEYYKDISLKKINHVKPYKNVTKIFEYLKKKKIKYSIVTSKDYKRSKYLLKKFDIKPCSIHCPTKNLRGKPFPDQILFSLRKNKIMAKEACFIGDTKIDYMAAKNAKVTFIFAKYGYGKNHKMYKYRISNFDQILDFM